MDEETKCLNIAYIDYLTKILEYYQHLEKNIKLFAWIDGKLKARL